MLLEFLGLEIDTRCRMPRQAHLSDPVRNVAYEGGINQNGHQGGCQGRIVDIWTYQP